jgi:hypothetical protein
MEAILVQNVFLKRRNQMDIRRKFWLVLLGAVAGMVIIACSCSSFMPKPTPTAAPVVTEPPVATEAPTATETPTATEAPMATAPATSQEAMPGLAGKWIDPDSTNGDTISTIEWANGGYVVTSVINVNRGGDELKTSSWENGVLTWVYCPANMQDCIKQTTVSLNGDTLTVDWVWSSGNNSGTSDLQRKP